jgi:hypothetical protein
MDITIPEAQAMLDERFPTSGAGDFIAYSTNGTSESSAVARHAVGATGWAAATNADPCAKANSGPLTSLAATAAATITHTAIFSAASAGTQRTKWKRITSSGAPKDIALAEGDTITWAVGKFQIRLT